MFSFTCCLSPLPSVPALSFPAGKWGKAAADRAGGQRSWSRVFPLVSPVLGHPGAVGWGGKSALQGWTRGGLQPRPGVSLCLTRIEVSIPAGLSLCQDLSQGPAGAFAGGWGLQLGILVWELLPKQPQPCEVRGHQLGDRSGVSEVASAVTLAGRRGKGKVESPWSSSASLPSTPWYLPSRSLALL